MGLHGRVWPVYQEALVSRNPLTATDLSTIHQNRSHRVESAKVLKQKLPTWDANNFLSDITFTSVQRTIPLHRQISAQNMLSTLLSVYIFGGLQLLNKYMYVSTPLVGVNLCPVGMSAFNVS